jgi:hypothetical protein
VVFPLDGAVVPIGGHDSSQALDIRELPPSDASGLQELVGNDAAAEQILHVAGEAIAFPFVPERPGADPVAQELVAEGVLEDSSPGALVGHGGSSVMLNSQLSVFSDE